MKWPFGFAKGDKYKQNTEYLNVLLSETYTCMYNVLPREVDFIRNSKFLILISS